MLKRGDKLKKVSDYDRGYEAAVKNIIRADRRTWAVEQAIRAGVAGADEIVSEANKLLKFISSNSSQSSKAVRKRQ